ncbi:2TM domain-containing protein [Chryseobacterium sp.]|uniref:2TM domain-containing protein n=1 Tax=Chryseobacterium sp. TaxID=1871047 RepID=UPI0025C2CF4C|nr:2TM domain-containing protein [Chryseobacterium sp.]MBV8327066.1 2TM domain-containing protein [Chryseobacterium sp.]
MEIFNEDHIQYQQAKRQVERLRRFYTHVFIYIAVNLVIVYFNYSNLKPGESYFQGKNFLTAIFWGIGVLGHGVMVFLPQTNLVRKWEEKKIRELMDQQKDK